MAVSTRTWFRTHSFTGIITGLMLFVICFSGTFAVFAPELDWLVTPGARVAPGDSTVSWGTIAEAAKASQPEAEINSFTAPLNSHAAATVWMSEADGGTRMVFVDPYTGRVTASVPHSYGVKRFFRNFHRFLFLPGIGLYLVSAFAITMLVSLVAALFFYKRWWTRFFRFHRTRGRAFWSELHKLAGLWSLWFTLVIVITGLWYLFEAVRGDFIDGKLNYVGEPAYSVMPVPAPRDDRPDQSLPLDQLIEIGHQAWPDFRIKEMGYGWYSGYQDVFYLGGQDRFPLVRPRANQMQIDSRSGEILWQNSAGELSPYWIWTNMADPLHFGDFAGWISKTIWFTFGLVLSGMILTGTWLHAHRLAGNANQRHRWPGTLASIVVTGLVLVASGYYGVRDALDYYGTVIDGTTRLPELAFGVKAVIVGWIALTLAILLAWAVLLYRPSVLIKPTRRQQRRRRQNPVQGTA